ncbi:M56 family metallopeptidase [Blautia ammoniilytica]|uniref:M56 family metallopeptidase n=1 Tax=Blautia ammoniilytica TaxID=2981782 RepID=A0ABT2U055_9FIRM|nr:M56 family metallopeptidase [Blautia ammoniilytica]MCU6767222.1 M56 family metallopeptidase [Blautia ammoniilytica]SCJ10245.1 Regulatory protein BlaR1 [uncultured Blautia sp.]
MEVFVLHILKLNIIAAVVILLVKVLAALLKGKVSARWKYVIWLIVAVSLTFPLQLPADLSVVTFNVPQYRTYDRQNLNPNGSMVGTENQGNRLQNLENMQSLNKNTQNSSENSSQKVPVMRDSGRWMGIAAVIFTAVWLVVAILKLAGEFLAYYLSTKNLERMSLLVSDPVSIQMYREVCQRKHVRRIPELRQNAGLTTPLLAGLFHTKLYLPATGYSAEERKLVFYHELTHYNHRDLWYKMFLRICASIYWFNPFLLLMLKEADKDIENLCDTDVIHRINLEENRLYRQLLLRTVAMDNQVPYVSASLNDSGMVFKDRILYMLNIRKFRRGLLPGILMAVLLVGGNLAFSVSAEAPEETGKTEQAETHNEKKTDQEKNNVPEYAPFSETVNKQESNDVQNPGADLSQNEETSTESVDAENSSAADTENESQENGSTDYESSSGGSGNVSHNENLPAGVPYTSGFSTASGVASIVAAGEGDEESRVLYDNGDGTYSDDYGFQYSYQGDGSWADANGNSYRTWNDEDYSFGTQLEKHELKGSSGTVNVKETTNGDYYYRDTDGVGYTNNGDGTWTDENGNLYEE